LPKTITKLPCGCRSIKYPDGTVKLYRAKGCTLPHFVTKIGAIMTVRSEQVSLNFFTEEKKEGEKK
jgi:hypothetical protein